MRHQEMMGTTEISFDFFLNIRNKVSIFLFKYLPSVLRIWSVSRRLCLRKIVIDFPSRSLCWSTDGKVMIVGIGGVPATSSKDGHSFVIVFFFSSRFL